MFEKIWNLIVSAKDAQGNLGKAWWRSKTLWVNIVAIIAVVIGKYANINLGDEDVVFILSGVNIVLRLITNQPTGFIEYKKPE